MHSLIVGVSRSGKSTLAFHLARSFVSTNQGVLILDPNNDAGWPEGERVRKVTDPTQYLEIAKRSRRCALFVDEAGVAIGRGKQARDVEWLTTRSRHWGHVCHVIAQRANQVDLTIRSQCSAAYVFRQSVYDAKLLAEQFADDALMRASSLGVGEFLYVRSCEPTKLMRLRL